MSCRSRRDPDVRRLLDPTFHRSFCDGPPSSPSGSSDPARTIAARVDVDERTVPGCRRIHAYTTDELGMCCFDAVYGRLDHARVGDGALAVVVEIGHDAT